MIAASGSGGGGFAASMLAQRAVRAWVSVAGVPDARVMILVLTSSSFDRFSSDEIAQPGMALVLLAAKAFGGLVTGLQRARAHMGAQGVVPLFAVREMIEHAAFADAGMLG